MSFDYEKSFDYENNFYLTASVDRFSKFVSHLDFFRMTQNLPGDIVECGVFKAVSLIRWIKFRDLLSNAYSRKIIGFDTFSEFPETEYLQDKKLRESFITEAGSQSIALSDLQSILEDQGLYKNIDLIAGDVHETILKYLEENPQLKISLLHIDVDLFEPTRLCLELLYDRVVRNGIIILDDYEAFPGAGKAIDDFFIERRETIRSFPFSHRIAFVEKL